MTYIEFFLKIVVMVRWLKNFRRGRNTLIIDLSVSHKTQIHPQTKRNNGYCSKSCKLNKTKNVSNIYFRECTFLKPYTIKKQSKIIIANCPFFDKQIPEQKSF